MNGCAIFFVRAAKQMPWSANAHTARITLSANCALPVVEKMHITSILGCLMSTRAAAPVVYFQTRDLGLQMLNHSTSGMLSAN